MTSFGEEATHIGSGAAIAKGDITCVWLPCGAGGYRVQACGVPRLASQTLRSPATPPRRVCVCAPARPRRSRYAQYREVGVLLYLGYTMEEVSIQRYMCAAPAPGALPSFCWRRPALARPVCVC